MEHMMLLAEATGDVKPTDDIERHAYFCNDLNKKE